MKKINFFNVFLGLVALGGAGYFANVAFTTDNMYKLGWSILLVVVSLCFITAPHYSNSCSKIFTWLVIPASIICLFVGIFTPGKNGTIIMALSFAGIGSGIGGLLLSVFLGWSAGTIVPTSDVEYSRERAAELCKKPLLTEKKNTNNKDASVVGRAVVGGVIAGGAGAVVGALSAVDENNRKHSDSADTKAGEDKDASVVGRAVVGGIIAGPAGAVVGAASAVDKNNRKHNKKDKK